MKGIIWTILLIPLTIPAYSQEKLNEPYLPDHFYYANIEGATSAKVIHYTSVQFEKEYAPHFEENSVKVNLVVSNYGLPVTLNIHYSQNLIDFIVCNGAGPATDSVQCFYENKRLKSLRIPSKIEIWKPYSYPKYDETYTYSLIDDSLSIFRKSIWQRDSSYSYALFDRNDNLTEYEVNFKRVYEQKHSTINEGSGHKTIEGCTFYHNGGSDTIYFSETYNFSNKKEILFTRQDRLTVDDGKLIYNDLGLLVEIAVDSRTSTSPYDLTTKREYWSTHIFYEYDSHNNWIKRIKIKEDGRGEITIRTITY